MSSIHAAKDRADDLVFSHCPACAEKDDGDNPHDPGFGCPAYGPSDDCAAVWVPAGRAALQNKDESNDA